jgi:hypothetical protein
MRRLLICLALVTGCRSFEVRAFDVPVAPGTSRLMAAIDDSEVTPLTVVAAAALVVGIGLLFYNYGSPESG